jgi:hypothetical protein
MASIYLLVDMGAKKADAAEHPKVFRRVGLLINEPPSLDRVALYIVIRKNRF